MTAVLVTVRPENRQILSDPRGDRYAIISYVRPGARVFQSLLDFCWFIVDTFARASRQVKAQDEANLKKKKTIHVSWLSQVRRR